MHAREAAGLRGFTTVWIGQVLSLVGSGMTSFALAIWIYGQTQSAAAVALTGTFFTLPLLFVSPFAGALVDRFDRKLMMMLSDLIGALASLGLVIAFATGELQLWQLYLAAGLKGVGQAFQWPAYSAAISTMVSREDYARANGMMALATSVSGIVAPALAAPMLGATGLGGIFLVDLGTFGLAVATLLIVPVPHPREKSVEKMTLASFGRESVFGFKYIWERPSLLAVQLMLLAGNLFRGIPGSVLAPMILARTRSNSGELAAVMSMGAVGAVAGGVLIAIWGGPRNRVRGIVLGQIGDAASTLLLGLGRTTTTWSIAAFSGATMRALINASNQALWQTKVAHGVQGRVFAARRLIAWSSEPLLPIVGGLMADRVLEPQMAQQDRFSNSLGRVVGTGAGSGMGVLFVACGMLGMLGSGMFSLIPAVRTVGDTPEDAAASDNN